MSSSPLEETVTSQDEPAATLRNMTECSVLTKLMSGCASRKARSTPSGLFSFPIRAVTRAGGPNAAAKCAATLSALRARP